MKSAQPVYDRLKFIGPITQMLDDWHFGDLDALREVMPLFYDLLRNQAGYYLDMEDAGFTLQPTALVNEAYLRLAGSQNVRFRSRTHFYFFISRLMRRVLVEHARARLTKRRGEGRYAHSLDDFDALAQDGGMEPEWLLSLEDALDRMEVLDPRRAQIVGLRFFVGLKVEEIAELLGISTRTVKRTWRTARLWLAKEIGRPEPGSLFVKQNPVLRRSR